MLLMLCVGFPWGCPCNERVQYTLKCRHRSRDDSFCFEGVRAGLFLLSLAAKCVYVHIISYCAHSSKYK